MTFAPSDSDSLLYHGSSNLFLDKSILTKILGILTSVILVPFVATVTESEYPEVYVLYDSCSQVMIVRTIMRQVKMSKTLKATKVRMKMNNPEV